MSSIGEYVSPHDGLSLISDETAALVVMLRGLRDVRVSGGEHPTHVGDRRAVQIVFEFPNGYGASVIRSEFSYGSDAGLWELGFLDGGQLSDRLFKTDQVRGWLPPEKVNALLRQIERMQRKRGER